MGRLAYFAAFSRINSVACLFGVGQLLKRLTSRL